jgi:hypothetical protein
MSKSATKVLNVLLDPDTMKQFRNVAKDEGRSMRRHAAMVLKQHLETRRQQRQPQPQPA